MGCDNRNRTAFGSVPDWVCLWSHGLLATASHVDCTQGHSLRSFCDVIVVLYTQCCLGEWANRMALRRSGGNTGLCSQHFGRSDCGCGLFQESREG